MQQLRNIPGLTTASWDSGLEAIVIVWESLYREDDSVEASLQFCLDYVRENQVKTWLCTVEAVKDEMNEVAARWSDEVFVDCLGKVGLELFVLATGDGAEEIAEWMKRATAQIGGGLEMIHVPSLEAGRTLVAARRG